MPQIQKGDTFADGQQVSGARLNQLIDSATILTGLITEQTNLTANTVASGDSVLLHDLSATALREATASDLLNSNLSITTSSITGGANSDIVITPNDGAIVTGATYTSGDGLTVVVTLNSHGLVVNQVVTISGAGSGYNGTFRITAVDANTFTYVMSTSATPATAQNCSYTRQGTLRNPEHAVIGGNLYVNGSTAIGGTALITGNTAISGNLTVVGTLTQSGSGTYTGDITQTGTVNITGAIQFNSRPVYAIYEWTDSGYGYVASGTLGGFTGSKYQSTDVQTKTNLERWEMTYSVACDLSVPYGAGAGFTSYTIKVIDSDSVVYGTATFPFVPFKDEGENLEDDLKRIVTIGIVLPPATLLSGVTLAVVVTANNSSTVSRVITSPTTAYFGFNGTGATQTTFNNSVSGIKYTTA
jgi:hypothetical protein